MNRYRKIFHHISIKDVKDKHLEESIATKLKQEKSIEEEKYITAEAEKLKVDWRKELEEEELKESDWTPISSGRPTMSTAQTFQHVSGGTATFGGLGGSDVHPTQVTLTVSGETFSVEAPTFNQLPLQGIPMPVSAAMPMHRRISEKKAEETNKQLDASEKVAAKAKADALMKARVTQNIADLPLEEKIKELEKRKKEVDKWKEETDAYEKNVYEPALKKRDIARKADAKERYDKVKKVVRDLGWKGSVTCWGTHEFQITGKYDPKKPSQKLIVIEKEKKLFGLDSPYGGGVVVHTITPYRNPDTGLYSKITKTTFKTPRKIQKLGTSRYHSPTNDDGKSEFGWSGIGNITTSSEFSLKDFPEPKYNPPEPPLYTKKNMEPDSKTGMPGWSPVSKQEEKDLAWYKAVFTTLPSGGLTFAAKMALQLARGDVTPVRKSPGPLFDNVIKTSIVKGIRMSILKKVKIATDGDSGYDPKTGIGGIRLDVLNTIPLSPVTASLGRYGFERTGKGLRIYDTYNISGGATNVGGAAIANLPARALTLINKSKPGVLDKDGKSVQELADYITGIGARRGAELGFDMVDADPPHNKLIPIGPGEEEYNKGNYKNDPYAPKLATPKGFGIDINYTIPWNQIPDDLKNLLGATPTTPATPKSKGRLDAYGGVSKLHDKKKKKVSESKVFDKIKKDFSYKGKPSPDGFPDTPPPKLKNGWHPEYGKVDNRYNRLDPISAKSMPKTGEASIDKKVEKAKKKKK